MGGGLGLLRAEGGLEYSGESCLELPISECYQLDVEWLLYPSASRDIMEDVAIRVDQITGLSLDRHDNVAGV